MIIYKQYYYSIQTSNENLEYIVVLPSALPLHEARVGSTRSLPMFQHTHVTQVCVHIYIHIIRLQDEDN